MNLQVCMDTNNLALRSVELGFSSFSHPPFSSKLTFWERPHVTIAIGSRKWPERRVPCFAKTLSYSAPNEKNIHELENKKLDLLRAVMETKRGLETTLDQRSSIEEALVTVEGYDAGAPIDLAKLDGTWRLQYTSAPDVLVLFEAAERFPILEVGQIFQKFECKNQTDGGVVRNVILWGVRSLLEEEDGATLLVSARFSVVSKRNIFLEFEEITLQDIKISKVLEAIVAPAILPRSFLSLQILQFFRTFKAQVPVANPGSQRRSAGGLYYLSFLDNNMLLGRAVGGGGVFVFTRAPPLFLG